MSFFSSSDNKYSKGRSTIDNPNRSFHSKRALKGTLTIEKSICPYCGHHKALSSINYYKCSRCKRTYVPE